MRSNVRHDAGKIRFFPPWQLAIFACVSAFLMFAFYPHSEIRRYFTLPFTIQPITLRYLNDVLVELSGKGLDVPLDTHAITDDDKKKMFNNMLTILKPQATNKESWELQWIAYQVLRWVTFSYKPGNPLRDKGSVEIKNSIAKFLAGPFQQVHFYHMVVDAQALEDPKLALRVYLRWVSLYPDQAADFFATIAKLAESVSEYQLAGQYYFLAMEKSYLTFQKRQYFEKGITVLLAGENYQAAILAVEKYASLFKDDKEILLFLNHVALRANKPKLAKTYLMKLLQLQSESEKSRE